MLAKDIRRLDLEEGRNLPLEMLVFVGLELCAAGRHDGVCGRCEALTNI